MAVLTDSVNVPVRRDGGSGRKGGHDCDVDAGCRFAESLLPVRLDVVPPTTHPTAYGVFDLTVSQDHQEEAQVTRASAA